VGVASPIVDIAVARIAMWSGPRTLSTAMMRSWENRADTVVVDEPLYAHYLSATGIDHPGREDIIASQRTDWLEVARSLTTDPLPPGRRIYYQKHMTHHMLPTMDWRVLRPLRHAFLIRDPHDLLASYSKVRNEPTLDDLGLRQQVELFNEFGGPVLDSVDLLKAPEASLRSLCAALDVQFDPAMLSWPVGRRDTDGVWAPHWYDGVWASTGFAPYQPSTSQVQQRLEPLLAECIPYYEQLASQRLRIEESD
jgi:sulfotransferase family protein